MRVTRIIKSGIFLKVAMICILGMTVMPGCNRKVQPAVQTPLPASPPARVETPVVSEERVARNIILLIGDGMGLAQITGGMYLNKNRTALENFPVIGLHKSHAIDNLVTDSAAGATAIASGIKTYNGAVGVDAQRKPRETILQEAQRKGYTTGLLATSSIVHATPASFFAHVPDRRQYEEIALYMLKTPVDIFVGGGRAFFNRRQDGRDLYRELQDIGYVIADYLGKSISEVSLPKEKKFAYLTADKEPLPVLSGRDYAIPGTHMVLEFLKNRSENGFFLMIEGSQIDWGGHANDAAYVLSEVREFDAIIDICFDFARRDKNTLVVVTSDHETGGFSINHESTMSELKISFTTSDHTAVMIPVFAFGPGSERFAGIYENTAIFQKMRQAYGWK